MVSKQYIPYDKFYKPKNNAMLLPEFWKYVLANQKKEQISYSTFYSKQK